MRLGKDPSGPQEVDGTYPPACQHPPGAWPWCVLDRTETKRERATVKMGMDRTQTDRTHGNPHTQWALESGVSREAETQAVLPVRRGQLSVTHRLRLTLSDNWISLFQSEDQDHNRRGPTSTPALHFSCSITAFYNCHIYIVLTNFALTVIATHFKIFSHTWNHARS